MIISWAYSIMRAGHRAMRDLSEAAVIDGCSVWGIFWPIVLPQLKPITITSIIFETMWTWNDFLAPMPFLNTSFTALVL